MSVVSNYTPCTSKFTCSPALCTMESSLQLSLSSLKDLVIEFENVFISSENYKTQFMELKEKCESKTCKSSETLKEIITAKDKIIESTASALTKLEETKNWNIIKEIYKILCGDPTPPSPKKIEVAIKNEPESPVYSPDKDFLPIKPEVNVKEESLLEIEGTPTGRTSPIIQPKRFRSGTSNTSNSDFRDKKKCPDSWPSSEHKIIKLQIPYPTPTKGNKSLRLRQTKLQTVKVKHSNTIDLTSSPEFSGGLRVPRSDSFTGVQTLIKKESIESDDTILPSPTSGPTNFSALYKSTAKNSPSKFKTPLSRLKCENVPTNGLCNEKGITDASNIEDSINLLQPKRRNDIKHQSPVKSPFIDKDLTNCETQKDESMSLLHHVKILEDNQENIGRKSPPISPHKTPLKENKNFVNVPEDVHIDSSMSLLTKDVRIAAEEKVKRRVLETVEPIYKEPTVRKKAEKRALPGWSCEECKLFYDELYKDDPEMLAKKMNECSKHRGKQNPIRPKTPDGYWNPRWDVPDDTEEFNRRNNVV